jgi:hypothetical protein
MDITVYLPDEIGRWAKDNDVKLSAMLRQAVERERERRKHNAAGSKIHELTVEGENGPYRARIHGTEIGEDLFLTDDEEIIGVDYKGRLLRNVDVGVLRDWFDDDEEYVAVMAALGEEAVVDIGAKD